MSERRLRNTWRVGAGLAVVCGVQGRGGVLELGQVQGVKYGDWRSKLNQAAR